MPEIDARLREDVHQLGELLGDTIREQYGPRFLDKIELIRKGAKAARRGSAEGAQQLTATLDGLEEDELLPVARAFNQFLNLANIAEQYHRIRRRRPNEPETLREPGAGRAAGASQGRRACPRATGSPARRAGDRTGADRPSHRGGAAHADPEIRCDHRATGGQGPCRPAAGGAQSHPASACSGWWPRPGIPTRSARSGRPR
ncbi:phosphoenolpyruvate carboxylase [Pseudomonas aeruginosa]|nr:phosphoenolpyruvate carboxylase [Pseudomonas aeruginosa]